MSLRSRLQRWIRPSGTRSVAGLWAKSLLNAALFFAVFLAALPWCAHRLLPAALSVPTGLGTGLAALLALLGGSVWLASLAAFVGEGRGTPLPADAPRHLVTRGPFSRVRNPIMTAELAILWAETLHFRSWGLLIYAVLVSATAHWMVVHVEEPELRKRFGAAYEAYLRRVPRWLPRLTDRPPRRGHIPNGRAQRAAAPVSGVDGAER